MDEFEITVAILDDASICYSNEKDGKIRIGECEKRFEILEIRNFTKWRKIVTWKGLITSTIETDKFLKSHYPKDFAKFCEEEKKQKESGNKRTRQEIEPKDVARVIVGPPKKRIMHKQ
jgi:hypothetical protein